MKTMLCRQGSPEWCSARLGIPTASQMDALVSPEGKVRTGQGVETFLYKKLCEKVLGFSTEASTFSMEQGQVLEGEARAWYGFERGIEVREVGICLTDDGKFGASPDGLIGEDGGLEVKAFQPEHALRTLMTGEVPKEYIVQIQSCLYVTGRAWWEFLSYSRQFPALIVRVEPDPKMQESIRLALELFYKKYDALLARITAMRDAENAVKEAAYYANTGTRD